MFTFGHTGSEKTSVEFKSSWLSSHFTDFTLIASCSRSLWDKMELIRILKRRCLFTLLLCVAGWNVHSLDIFRLFSLFLYSLGRRTSHSHTICFDTFAFNSLSVYVFDWIKDHNTPQFQIDDAQQPMFGTFFRHVVQTWDDQSVLFQNVVIVKLLQCLLFPAVQKGKLAVECAFKCKHCCQSRLAQGIHNQRDGKVDYAIAEKCAFLRRFRMIFVIKIDKFCRGDRNL